MKKHFEAQPQFEFTFENPYKNTLGSASWKKKPQDFLVEEQLDIEFSGEGEFLWVYIEKTELNTETMAKYLAKALRINADKISWSGLKDKTSVSKQWFSIHLGGRVDKEKVQPRLELAQSQQSQWRLLECHVHSKKLRIGTHSHNCFKVNLNILDDITEESINQRLISIKEQGFPNYFGRQRFGRNFSNLKTAEQLFINKKQIPNRHLKGLALSAARSWLFNHQVTLRIQNGNFHQVIQGDVLTFETSSSLFTEIDDETQLRMDQLIVHPTALLPGQGNDLSSADSLALETQIEEKFPQWVRSLKDHKLKKERRAIRVVAHDLNWSFGEKQLQLNFQLKKGSFASSLLDCVFDMVEEEI